MRRKTKESIQMVAMGVLLGAGVMASFLFLGLRAKAAPSFFSDLASIDRQEIADMRNSEDWVEPWTLPISQDELNLFAALVWSEAGDQPLPDGLCYVADVVLNRVDSPRWPNSISGVIYQPGQFSVVSNGALDRAYLNCPQVAYDAVISQLQNRWNSQIQFFSMGYLANGSFAFVHGTHYFGY